jgi:hypothetical protein
MRLRLAKSYVVTVDKYVLGEELLVIFKIFQCSFEF